MLTSLLLLAFLAPAPLAAPAAPEGDRLSLEELLERYRVRRDERLGELRGDVGAIIDELETLGASPTPSEIDRHIERLLELGAACAPLLVPLLEPGPDATDAVILRSRIVARVMRELPNFAVTGELLAILGKGTRNGELNALRVLALTEDAERAGPALRKYIGRVEGTRRAAALTALAKIGGDENNALLGKMLGSKDAETARHAMDAVAQAGNEAVAEHVRALVRITSSGTVQVRAIVTYYRACPAVVDSDVLEDILRLARARGTSADGAEQLLELIAENHKQFDSGFKRALHQLADKGERKTMEGALIALVRGGDRSAKRTLLEPYDDRVTENRSWARAYEDRADVYYKIGDWKNAKKDYLEALSQRTNSSRNQSDVYLQTARCWARMGKVKDAAQWIEKAPVTLGQRRALALDPVFAEVARHPKYREVFRLQ